MRSYLEKIVEEIINDDHFIGKSLVVHSLLDAFEKNEKTLPLSLNREANPKCDNPGSTGLLAQIGAILDCDNDTPVPGIYLKVYYEGTLYDVPLPTSYLTRFSK